MSQSIARYLNIFGQDNPALDLGAVHFTPGNKKVPL